MMNVMVRYALLACILIAGLNHGVDGACKVTFKDEEVMFDSCSDLDLDMKVFWSFTDDNTIKVAYTKSITDSQYVAFGFGEDTVEPMVPSSVVVAFPQADKVVVDDYALRAKNPTGVVAEEGGQMLVSKEAEMADGVLTTVFERPLAGDPDLNRNQMATVLYAYGEAPEIGKVLERHTNRAFGPLNLTTTAQDSKDSPSDEEGEEGVCIESSKIPEHYSKYLVHPSPIPATVLCIEEAPGMPCGTAHHALQVDGTASSYQEFCKRTRCFKKCTVVNAVYKHRWENQIFTVGETHVAVTMGDDRYHSALYGAVHLTLEMWSLVVDTLPRLFFGVQLRTFTK